MKSFVLGILILAAAFAQAPPQPGLGFAVVGIAAGHTARVNVVNLGSPSSTKDSSCGVTLQFLDLQGRQIKQSEVSVGVGKGAFLDLSRAELPGDQGRVAIRAILLFGY